MEKNASLNSDCSRFVRQPPLSQRLHSLDPFQHIDPVDTFSHFSESSLLFPEAVHDDVNEQYDSAFMNQNLSNV